ATVWIAPGAAEILVDRLAVRPDDRARVDHRLVDRRPRGREPRARALDRDGAEARRPAPDGERRGELVRVRDGRDRDRVRGAARRAGGAEPEVIAVVAGR